MPTEERFRVSVILENEDNKLLLRLRSALEKKEDRRLSIIETVRLIIRAQAKVEL